MIRLIAFVMELFAVLLGDRFEAETRRMEVIVYGHLIRPVLTSTSNSNSN